VRELSNIVEQALLTSSGERVGAQDLPVGVRRLPDQVVGIMDDESGSYNDIVGLTEYRVLSHALAKYGSTHKAAKHLKISQSTIVRKLRKLQSTRD
jgi:transcriptional regulator with PAS, ATPase and Fis domain